MTCLQKVDSVWGCRQNTEQVRRGNTEQVRRGNKVGFFRLKRWMFRGERGGEGERGRDGPDNKTGLAQCGIEGITQRL